MNNSAVGRRNSRGEIDEEEARMNITVNGINVNYTLEGPASGPLVTMSNSLASNLSMWAPQVPVLTSRYPVLRYDTRGHGGT
jgi:3-oxoadipate enol-lactonase